MLPLRLLVGSICWRPSGRTVRWTFTWPSISNYNEFKVFSSRSVVLLPWIWLFCTCSTSLLPNQATEKRRIKKILKIRIHKIIFSNSICTKIKTSNLPKPDFHFAVGLHRTRTSRDERPAILEWQILRSRWRALHWIHSFILVGLFEFLGRRVQSG